ncbi:MAG: hypothetical protein H6711_16495 [Myxococcales bacterium]|nr:hypothetical protein [Myxococcales bacterium]
MTFAFRPSLALLASFVLVACGDDGGGSSSETSGGDGSTSGEASTSSDASTSAGTSEGTSAGTASGGSTSEGTSTSAGTSASTSSTSGDATGTGSTSGGAEYCAGWEDAPAPAFLALDNLMMEPLVPGATLPLECGGQGLFMFGLYPRFGGFTPASEFLDFSVVVDVEGFNDNPEGHFFSGPVSYYLGCEPILGGVGGVLPVIPWDEIPDLTALDGEPAQVHVVMHAPGGDVTVDVEVVLSAVKDDGWAFCGG